MAPDDAETDVNTLLLFFNVTPLPAIEFEGHKGFSMHSSGLKEEKSARIPLSVNRAREIEIESCCTEKVRMIDEEVCEWGICFEIPRTTLAPLELMVCVSE